MVERTCGKIARQRAPPDRTGPFFGTRSERKRRTQDELALADGLPLLVENGAVVVHVGRPGLGGAIVPDVLQAELTRPAHLLVCHRKGAAIVEPRIEVRGGAAVNGARGVAY